MSTILQLYEAAKIDRIDEAVVNMERNGFMLDTSYCERGFAVAKADERARLDALAKLLPGHENPDAVWSSHPQLIEVLEKRYKLPPSPYKVKGKVKLHEGQRSTDKRAMDYILEKARTEAQRELVTGVLDLRKIRSSMKYLEKLPRYVAPDGFVHPVCGPADDEDSRVGAETGRLAMKNPEAMQIPKDAKKDRYYIRRAFVAPPGWKLVISDYTALEVVILANISKILFNDRLLLDLTLPGMDIHAYNAHRIFGTFLDWRTESGRRIKDLEDPALYKSDKELEWYRDIVKAIWYKLSYGGTAYSFGMSLKDKNGALIGEKRAQEILDALFHACPPMAKWHAWAEKRVQTHASMLGMDGRLISYQASVDRGKWGYLEATRGAKNAAMQITGAAVIGSAMVAINECPEFAKMGAKHQLQIHDENQIRVREEHEDRAKGLLKEHMENAYPLENLRATVGSGDNWLEAK